MSSLFDKALAAEGITGALADLARSIYMQESGGGRNTKTSNAGAVGGMQIIPSTFASVADKDWDINNPEQNARAGIRYIRQMSEKVGGDPRLTAVGYYGGPGAIDKARKGIPVRDPRNPNAPDTFGYADSVVARMPAPAVVAAAGGAPVAVVPEAQPVVVADAPPQMPVQMGYVAPEVGSWQEFQQVMPRNITPKNLDFATKMPVINPMDYLAKSGGEVNFTPFKARRVKV